MTGLGIIIMIICALLSLMVLAQNPKGGGLAQGFTGAQQIGGVQKTANFLEKGTWTLSTLLLVLCLVSAAIYSNTSVEQDEFDQPISAEQFDLGTPIEDAPTGEQSAPPTANP